MASDETKEAILDFSKRYVLLNKVTCSTLISVIRIQKMIFPESSTNVVQWHQDKDRQSWHTHCAKMDDIWEDYLTNFTKILGYKSDFDLSTLAKPTGPLWRCITHAVALPCGCQASRRASISPRA